MADCCDCAAMLKTTFWMKIIYNVYMRTRNSGRTLTPQIRKRNIYVRIHRVWCMERRFRRRQHIDDSRKCNSIKSENNTKSRNCVVLYIYVYSPVYRERCLSGSKCNFVLHLGRIAIDKDELTYKCIYIWNGNCISIKFVESGSTDLRDDLVKIYV